MGRRARILRTLREAGEQGVSGSILAEQLGVSRVAVSKHVAALREQGYVIDATPGTGYHLRSVPDLPLPSEVEPLTTDPFWVRFEGGAVTVSTNDDAKRLARGGAIEGTVVVAGVQTAGRGRLGREWTSPEGGVYLSVVLRPNRAPATIVALPLVVSLGVSRGLEHLGCRPLLKWPNDVWLAGPTDPSGKVAGVLLEMQAESDCVEWVVAGVGINVQHENGRVDGAAYVPDHAPACGTARVAAAVLDGIASAYREFLEQGFDRLSQEYAGRSMLAGRTVTVREIDGRVAASGAVHGVDAQGRLLLEGPSGMLAVSTGDVTLRELGA